MQPVLVQATATRLADGRVLIAGGMSRDTGNPAAPLGMPHPVGLAEIYDPATGMFTKTGSMAAPRVMYTATLLLDGRVLVAGGADQMDGFGNLATAELYDPSTGKFTATGSMSIGRAEHTAALLTDGRVLVAGGYGGGTSPLATAEIYDPATGRFTKTGPMTVARRNHSAMLLGNGRVLIAGGQTENPSGTLASAEVWDPASGKFTPTGSMTTGRYQQFAAQLPDGRVLVGGGIGGPGDKVLSSAEVYDPSSGKFTRTGAMSGSGQAVGTPLADGRVLVACTFSLSIYDPSTGAFKSAGTVDPSAESTTLLLDGRVLLLASDRPQLFVP
jgi:deoxycytidylate deaminase